MTKRELKLIAGEIIKITSGYSISAKKQLFNYILNEDNIHRLKSFILDNKIINLNEYEEKNVNERFKLFFETLPTLASFTTTTFGVLAAVNLIRLSYELYEKFISREGRKCKGAINKEECLREVRADAVRKRIEYLNKNLLKCNKTRNKEKCKSVIEDKLEKLKIRLLGHEK